MSGDYTAAARLHRERRQAEAQRKAPKDWSPLSPVGRAPIGGLIDHPDFQRNFQFGIIDNGLLVLFTLLGFSLEDKIAAKVGVRGYGPIMGATIGNAISDGVAAVPQGTHAAFGVTAGALAPVIPFAVAMAMKKEVTGTTRHLLVGSSAALLLYAFTSKRMRQSDAAGKQTVVSSGPPPTLPAPGQRRL